MLASGFSTMCRGDRIRLIGLARSASAHSHGRPFTVSCPTRARLPYFHKKLRDKNTALALEYQQQPSSPQPPPSSPALTSRSKQQAASQPSVSKRQAFKAITPSDQIMHEIRIQGLGSKAKTWSFDKSSRGNKTIRPWHTQDERQEQKRLPPKQVWFEQRNSKVVEKEQVRFPTMRFVAGAASVASIPSEQALLEVARPDLFRELERVDDLLRDAGGEGEHRATTRDAAGASKNDRVRLTIAPEEHQKLREQKRKAELEIKDSVLQEIAIVGRSNVGKSTMLNTLTGSPNTARVSSKPGLTRQLNFYRCGDKFVLVDMPGYGFAFAKEEDKTRWKELIEHYLGSRKTLRRIYVMIDARHGLKVPDREFLTMLDSKSKKFQVVLTKCDLVSPPDLARCYKLVQEELKRAYRHAIAERLLMVSSYTGAGMNTLRKDLLFTCGENILIRDRERPKSTFR